MSSALSSTSSLSYANSPDRNNPADSARRNIGRQIIPTRAADESRRPTRSPNPESGSGTESIPAINVSDVHNVPIGSNAAFVTNAELYSNLATYSFGSPRSSSTGGPAPSPYEGNGDTFVSPLTPMARSDSADRTPRPSVSSPGNNNRSHPSQSSPPQDQRSLTSSQRSSRPRGSHRPPEAPEADDDSIVDFDYQRTSGRGRVMSDTASQHTFGGARGFASSSTSVDDSRSPSRSSDRSIGHEFSSEEELDLEYEPSSHDTYIRGDFDPDDTLSSSRYSQATISGRRGSLPMAIPGSAGSSSGAMDEASRGREDSLVTLRRPSRSLDDDLSSVVIAAGAQSGEGRDLSVEPTSEPMSRADFRNLHDHIEQRQQQQQQNLTPTAPSSDAYEAFDLNYIIGDMGSRRGSLAPSYIQQRELPQRQSLGFRVGGWGSGLQWSGGGRRPSTATTGTTDDVFIRHAQRFDEHYAFASLQWSFRREQADGRGPPVTAMSIRSGQSREPVLPNAQQTGRGTTMMPGSQELWRHEFVGRFKIDRMALMSRRGDPTKPPQQRLNVRHIHDPFSKGNKAGGPTSVIHKHSKAMAFSIYRRYSLLNRSSSGTGPSNALTPGHPNRGHSSMSGGIMLAPKKVQEEYTSTRTTSKLASHGLLGDSDDRNNMPRTRPGSSGGRRNTSVVRREAEKKEKERREKEKKQREKEEKAKSKAKKSQQKKGEMTESVDSTSTQASTVGTSSLAYSQADTIETYSTKAEGRARRDSANQVRQVIVSLPTEQSPISDEPAESEASSSIISSSIGRRVSFEGSQGSRTVVGDQARPPGESLHHDDPYEGSTTEGLYEGSSTKDHDSANEDDDDRIMTVSRTPHAEAFTTLDPNVIEYVRSKGSRIAADGSVSWTKRLFGRSTRSNTNAPDFPGPSAAAREATYVPPWMTIADRKAQESNEKLIQNLNDSFKDVGLVHTLKPSKSSGKGSKRTNNSLFDDMDDDVLYMLLPLWAGETDNASTPPTSAIVTDTIPPIEDRLYLLVWYNPFENKPEHGRNDNPKKKNKSSPDSSLDNKTSKTVFVPQFKVSARLIGYDELRGTGVRLPSIGLSVTGPLWEAMQDAPKSSLRQEHPGDCLLAVCFGREKGVEFLTDGVEKVGLCLPTEEVERPYVPESDHLSVNDPEREVFLSAIGRAAVEMIWLGCMALTSFGSV